MHSKLVKLQTLLLPLALLIGLAIVSCGALGILYTAKKRRK